MEYFDSKVLESFMIPEDSIATEGIIGKAFNLIVTFVKLIIKMVGNLISIIGKFFSKLVHRKTVHTDKETFQQNEALVKKYWKLITNIHYTMHRVAFDISTYADFANTYLYGESNEYFDSKKNRIDNAFEKFTKDCNIINKELSGKVLFLNETEYDIYTSTLNESKEELEKIKEKMQTTLDKAEKESNKESSENIAEFQRRSAYFTNMMSKVSSLYTTTCNTLSKCISSDVITMTDRMKYHDDTKE